MDGHQWEDLIASWHALYLADGLADIQRQEPPTTHRSRRPRRVARGPVDFGGDLLRGPHAGRRFVAEAKAHTDERNRSWPLAKLHKHQGADLQREHAEGAISGVLLLMRGRGWWIPWDALQAVWALAPVKGHRSSIGEEWLAANALPLDMARGWWPVVAGGES